LSPLDEAGRAFPSFVSRAFRGRGRSHEGEDRHRRGPLAGRMPCRLDRTQSRCRVDL